jgi:hypothetical protein
MMSGFDEQGARWKVEGGTVKVGLRMHLVCIIVHRTSLINERLFDWLFVR